jgi:hypothetical protein
MSTTPAMAHQLGLQLRDPRWRPVMDLNGVMSALDLDAREVVWLCERNEDETAPPLVAWNIAVNDVERAGTKDDPNPHRCLRVLVASIEHYRATLGSRPFGLSWEQIVRLMLPPGHSSPVLLGTDIQRSLNCGSDLVIDLIRTGKLETANGGGWKPGPAGSPRVMRESFLRFLKGRLL